MFIGSDTNRGTQLPITVAARFLIVSCLVLQVVTCLLNCPRVAHAQTSTKRILILDGYGPSTPASIELNDRMREVVRQSSSNRVEFYYEFQDNARIPNEKYDAEMVGFFKGKYAGEKLDLLVGFGAPAVDFLLKHETELFTGVPKIFYFHDEPESKIQSLWPHVTGVWTNAGLTKTLDAVLALHPNTQNVVVVSGNSVQDRFFKQQAQEAFRGYEGKTAFTYLPVLTMEELKNKVASLPPRTVVLYLSFFLDKNGNTYSGREALSSFAPSSTAPIYGISNTYMGYGIVGGSVIDFPSIGSRLGELTVRILDGENPAKITPQNVPTVSMFDWNELRRWRIDETKLPAGAVVQFKQSTLWATYKWYIIALIGAVIAETGLIFWLLFLRRRYRQAETEGLRLTKLATRAHKRLEELVSNVPGVVWESRIDPDSKVRKTTFISEYLYRMLGYTPEEWLKQEPGFGLQVMPEEDRETTARVSETVVETGKDGVCEFRWYRKDGSIRWVENHLSPMVDENSDVIGLRGVALDITNRKLAEETARRTEEKDRAILAAIPDLMFVQTREGVYLDYHAKDERDLFVPPDQFLGKNMRDILPRDLTEQLFACFERAEEAGEPQILEYQLTLHENDRWFEARVVRSEEKVVTVIRDITQRVLIEEALKSDEAQLSGIIGSAMDGIITVDENEQIMLFNAAAEKIFGCQAGDAVGQSLEQFIPERYRTAHHRHIHTFGKNDVAQRVMGERGGELCGRKRSGEEFPMEASISQIQLSGKKLFTVILRDISDSKRALDELRDSEKRFSKAFRANPQPMSLTTVADGRYLDVNDSFLSMSGYLREEVIGRTSLEVGFWETWERRVDFIGHLLEAGSAKNVETRFRTKNGSVRILLSSAERLELGGQDCLVMASSDISDRMKAQEELRKAHDELIIAHDEVNHLKNQLEAENIYLQEELQQDQAFGDMVGQSPAIKHVLYKVSQVAPIDSTVLITGETGTGKELVARAIHAASTRKDRPLIKVNCAALSPNLIESELFGHEKGAFTGAATRKLGRFELANTGTFFLDEIGELPLDLQVKLLRVLQEGEFERVGGAKTLATDVRIIAATNRDLKLEVEKGEFRQDLWYRLNVFPITTPSLRERREDIPLLTEHFAKRFAQKFGKQITAVSPNTMAALCEYSWPGNIRELANVVERAVINSRGPVLRIREEFAPQQLETTVTAVKTLEEMEREHILRVLENVRWRIQGPRGAARILGINPSTLRTRMVKLGINKAGENSMLSTT
jgi:PAS domain S-box-containing protein